MRKPASPPLRPRWDDDPDGLPRRVTSPDGTPLVRRAGDADGDRLWLRLPDHREIALRLDAAEHPVLGRCDAITSADGETLALGRAVDWRRPTEVPALDRPGALPPGAGTALLDFLAWQALRAGTGPLRYHGPYPSLALWQSLQASFRVHEPLAQAQARFLADAEARALAGTIAPIDVAFHPAPHTWHWPHARICVQHRVGIERVYLDGHPFDPDPTALRRLRREGDDVIACVVVGDTTVAELLRLHATTGQPRLDPAPLPPGPAALVGTALPPAVVEVLGEVVLAQAPRLLQPALRHVLASARIEWGDPGLALVRWRGNALQLHAGLLPALPTEPTALLGVLVHAVQAPLRRAAASRLAAAWSSVAG